MNAIRTATTVVAALLAAGVARAADQPKPATQASGPASARAAQTFPAEIILGEISLQPGGGSTIPVFRVRVVDTAGKDVTTYAVVRLTLCGGWHELAVVPQSVQIPKSTFPCKVEASIDQTGPAPVKARPVSRTYTAPMNERGSSVSPK